MIKKIISTALTLCMVFCTLCCVPYTVQAASSGTCGTNLSWSISSSTLTITGTGDMEDYTVSASIPTAPWYTNRTGIKYIVVAEGVTGIGDYAFYGLNAAISVRIATTVTDIGAMAMRNCTAITALTIPENVKQIGNSAFYGCSSLLSVTYSATACETMGYSSAYPVFAGCTKLTSIVVSPGVTQLPAYAFEYATALTSLSLPATLKTIGEYVVSYCSSLQSVSVPNTVTEIGKSAFQNDTALSTITLSEKLSKIGDSAFRNCSALKTLTFGTLVYSIGSRAFENTGITSLEIESTVTFIGDDAFDGCAGILIKTPQYSYAHRYCEVYGINCEITRYAGEGSGTGGGTSGDVVTTTSEIYTINDTVVVYSQLSQSVSNYAFHIALYDSSNQLVDYIIVPILKSMNQVNVVFPDNGKATKAKIFLWNSILQCTPLNTAEVLTITRN